MKVRLSMAAAVCWTWGLANAGELYPNEDRFDVAPPMTAVSTVPQVAPSLPVAPAQPPARARVRGSLYSDAGYQSLTSDRKQFRAGDIVTLLIAENTSASSTADTGTARDSNVGLGVTIPQWTKGAGVVANNDFAGTGRTQRGGRVLGQLTVTVREVLANGDLTVAGEQLLEINGEKQTVRAQGRLRPRDINEQNVALSTRLADARLAFVGDGVLGDQQRPRWWQQVLALFGL
jgi:flagellar L-ring protein precursor FlgH